MNDVPVLIEVSVDAAQYVYLVFNAFLRNRF
jgi:hypothetical protein